jgi:hypothetical protein
MSTGNAAVYVERVEVADHPQLRPSGFHSV